MRRLSTILITVALVLGLAQCKKEQPTPQSEGVMITLNVGDNNNGSRANVNPTGTEQVTFVDGDHILVAYDGHYVGTLEKATVGSVSQFSGTINITQSDTDQPLYFYFLGNKQGTLATGATTCTVNISDQTTTAGLPVISMGKSIDAEGETVYYESGMTSFSSRLYNKCSLMKFNVTTLSTAAICITDMNNKVTVDFGKYDETGTGLEGSTTNNGFSYSKDGSGMIKMPGVASSGASTWAIVLPQAELTTEGEANSVYTTDGYAGIRPRIHEITSNCYYNGDHEDDINLTLTDVSIWDGDLSKLTNESTPEFATARDGMTIYNELTANVKVSIADGATVTLHDVNITNRREYCDWPGINCIGDATLVLEGTNTVCAGLEDDFSSSAPGIYIAENKTLIIRERGDGRLTAYSGGDDPWGAGIGAGVEMNCGNIVIESGTIIAGRVSPDGGAGIGSALYSTCGTIEIKGGTVTAIGGGYSAGIGSGYSFGTGSSSSCGNITINSGVTSVTATSMSSVNLIGAGYDGTCGTVTFDNVVMYNGSSWTTTPTNGGTYGGLSLAITTDEYDAITWTLTPYVAPSVPEGAINGLFTIDGDGNKVYFSQGNLQYIGSSGTWKFADTQWEVIGTSQGNTSQTTTRDLFGWGTSGWDSGNTYYHPWDTDNSDYSLYGPPGQYNLTGSYAQADWGYNAISNGGNAENSGWRTLTNAEWGYVFNTRSTASGIRYAKAKVNNVNGVILLPDDWSSDTYSLNSTGASFSSNTISALQWNTLEQHGAVFLPAAGYREGTDVEGVGGNGCYWSSTPDEDYDAYGVDFDDNYVYPNNVDNRHYGQSVRLVRNAK